MLIRVRVANTPAVAHYHIDQAGVIKITQITCRTLGSRRSIALLPEEQAQLTQVISQLIRPQS